jgi:betaine-aldehyde dehydrogenase
VKQARELRVGDGLDKVDIGPMASQHERARVEAIVTRAIERH